MRVPAHARLSFCRCVFVCLMTGLAVGQRAPDHTGRVRRFLGGRSVAGGKVRAAEALVRARGQHVAMLQARPEGAGLAASWQAMGPNQIASLSYGLVTGRVSSVAVDPNDGTGNTVYLGTTGGGVWKSTNAAGVTGNVAFAPLTDTLSVFSAGAGSAVTASLSIGAVSVAPGGGVLLAGTGDVNDATDSYYGEGILRSADGGVTWTLATESHDGVAGNHSFVGLGTAGFAWGSGGLVVAAMSSSAEGVVVNAASAQNSVEGLYYSSDAGVTWQMGTLMDGGQVVQQPLSVGLNGTGNGVTAVVWDGARGMFFAAVRFHGVYGSADGMTWTRLGAQPGVGLTAGNCPANPGGTGSATCPFGRGVLAVQGVTGDLFALSVDGNNLDQGIWQDVCGLTGGHCASTVAFGTRIPSAALEVGGGSTEIPQGDYDLVLAAAPAAAGDGANTVLYVGTEDLYRCGFANGSGGGCVLRNTTNALNGCAAPAMVAAGQHGLGVLALTAPLVYLGNDGGLWRSVDGVAETGAPCSATDAGHFENLNGGLGSLAESVGLAAHPSNGDVMVLGVGANGTAGTAAASGLGPWAQWAAGEGGKAAVDQVNPQNVFISTGPGVSLGYCAKGSGCGAADFAGSPVVGEAQVDYDAAEVDAPFLLDPAVTADVVVGTCRVWRGLGDSGVGWSGANAISAAFGGPVGTACVAGSNAFVRSLGAGGPVSGVAAAENAGSTVLYAGMAGVLDGGGAEGGTVWMTAAGGSDGAGSVWTDRARTNVTNDPGNGGEFNPAGFDVSAVVADGHDATGMTVYATVMGFSGNGLNSGKVYRSVDGGAHWLNVSSNLPNAPANGLAVDPNDANTVYVALDTGVYVTTQIATCGTVDCWSVYGVGLPNAPVVGLVASVGVATGDGRTGELRAATYGRGVWQIPLLTAVSPAVPGISLNPVVLTFVAQAVGTESGAQTVVLTNSGNAPLTVSSIAVTGDFVESDGCTGVGTNVLAAGGTCAIAVRFLPSATGARTGVMTVYGNAPGGQGTVALGGTGTTAAAIVLTPVMLSFATTTVGAASAAQNITISNTGGTAAGLQLPVIVGSDFKIAANTCGSTLAAGTGCTVSIVFAPLVAGARSGTFSITDDAGTQTAALSGTGAAAATDGLAPLALVFGAQILSTASTSQTVTLTNVGDQPLTLVSAGISSGDFTAVNGCGAVVIGHTSCAIGVTYVPKSVGAETGVLTVSDEFRSQTVALSGFGVAPAGVTLSPIGGLVFGATAAGTVSAGQTVTLSNSGGSLLTIGGIVVGGEFGVVAGSNTCGSTLAAGAACSVGIAFAPAGGGAQVGSVAVTDNAAGSPQVLALSGTGVDFTLAASGASSVTIASGGSAVYPMLLTSAGGTPGTAAMTCLGAPVNATCTVVPMAPALGGTTVITVTVETGVTAQVRGGGVLAGIGGVWVWVAGLVPVWVVGRRRRLRGLVGCWCLLGLVGCGAGRQVPGVTTTSAPVLVTPSGSYSLAVSAASAGLIRTVNVTLVVQ
jgi:hypothetical protein